jgi:hypothetical protein
MMHGTCFTFSGPNSSLSIVPSWSPRRPTSPTPALTVYVMGDTPSFSEVVREIVESSAPVSTMKSCGRLPLTRPWMMIFSFSSRNGSEYTWSGFDANS